MISPLSDPLYRPGMAAFAQSVVRQRLLAPTILEVLARIRQETSRIDFFA